MSSRKSLSKSHSVPWKNRNKGPDHLEARFAPISKKKKLDTPQHNQRSITSYFTGSSSNSTQPKFEKTLNRKEEYERQKNENQIEIEVSKTNQFSQDQNAGSLESTQPILIETDEEDNNDELDSQATEVILELDPLAFETSDAFYSESFPAQSHDLYYFDKYDSLSQYYDVDAAVYVHQMKITHQIEFEKQKTEQNLKRSISSQEETYPDAGIAYYLSNFMVILNIVMTRDIHLFDDEEKQVFEILKNCKIGEQKLFSRLLYRKGPWFQVLKLSYNDIYDIPNCISGLISKGLLEEPNSILDILPHLSNVQLRSLTKSPSNMKREQLLSTSRKWATSQRTLDGKQISTPKELGKCVRIKEKINTLFKRVHRLFFLNQVEDQTTLILIHTGKIKFPTYLDYKTEKIEFSKDLNDSFSFELSLDENRDGPTPPMSPNHDSDLNILKMDNQTDDIEELENIKILKKIGFKSVFKTRKELDEYEYALSQSHELVELLGSDIDVENDTTDNEKRKKQTPNAKNLNDENLVKKAMIIIEDAVNKYKEIISTESDQQEAKFENQNLFLKRFSSKWVFSSIIWVGVGILERQKKYKEAIEYLEMLLNQYDVNRGRRGDWWIRLIFDVSHLKQFDKAIQLSKNAIMDQNCRPQHLLKLYDKLRILLKTNEREKQKAEKASKSAKNSPQKENDQIVDDHPENEEDEEVVILKPSPNTKMKQAINSTQQHEDKNSSLTEISTIPSTTPSTTPSSKKRSPASQKATKNIVDDQTELTNTPSKSSPMIRKLRRGRSITIPCPEKEHGHQDQEDQQQVSMDDQENRSKPEISLIPLPEGFIESKFNPDELSMIPSTPKVIKRRKSTLKSSTSPSNHSVVSDTLSSDMQNRKIDLIAPMSELSPSQHESVSEPSPSKSPLKSPNIRHTSPVRYFNKSEKEMRPLNYKSDDEQSVISAEFQDILRKLDIPIPDSLHPGTVNTIYGKRGQVINQWGGKQSFFYDLEGNPCSVEKFSLEFYFTKSDPTWPCGEHCEGSPYYTLFALLFWDILFDVNVPYVFQTPYQDAPLDLTTEAFYLSRKRVIDERLNMIFTSPQTTDSAVAKKIEDSYFRWHGRSCRGVDWSRWKIKDLLDISRCLGGPVLSIICERFAIDYRFTHSGLPDLLLWNPQTNKAKLVEVKGPNDKLSEKQKIWIDALARRGCDIVTLYVKKEEEEQETKRQTDDLEEE